MLEDGDELVAVDAVIDVGGDPDLENALALSANLPATVDELFLHKADLGDVEVRGDMFSARKSKGDRFIGVGSEGGVEVSDGHL